MTTIRLPLAMLLMLFVAACVTINVYFPAEAAEKAADRIIRDVYGEEPVAPAEPQSFNGYRQIPVYRGFGPLDWL